MTAQPESIPALLDRLEGLAKAATPGPWTNTVNPRAIHGDPNNDGWTPVAQSEARESPTLSARHKQWLSNAAFIAAANPETILTLCRELRETRTRDEARERYDKEMRARWKADPDCARIDEVRAHIAGLQPGDAEALVRLQERLLTVESELREAGEWKPISNDELAQLNVLADGEAFNATAPKWLRPLLLRLHAAEAKLNTPEIADFAKGVVTEAQHQRDRWGGTHDAGKAPLDWFWLIGYLAQKAATAQLAGDINKALHHTISTAAALANWHAAISGANTLMRPGILPPKQQEASDE